ncbi:hypothetical protein BW716_30390 [[Flexibacter] sp. ATCC 35208]|nr:hypothetical protein BW716_30390 [[Flexibacter] sp. ATCC 35208]
MRIHKLRESRSLKDREITVFKIFIIKCNRNSPDLTEGVSQNPIVCRKKQSSPIITGVHAPLLTQKLLHLYWKIE